MGKANISDRVMALERSAEATPWRWYVGSTTRVLMMQCRSGSCFSRADLKSLRILWEKVFSCAVSSPSFLHLATISGRRAYWVMSTCSSLICLVLSSLKVSAIQPMIWFEVLVLATRNSHSGLVQREEISSAMRSIRDGRTCCSWMVWSCL